MAQADDDEWMNLARQLGLSFETDWMGGRRIEGEVRGAQVFIGEEKVSKGAALTTVTIGGNIDPGVQLHTRNALAALFGGQRVELGDPEFDRRFDALGPEPIVLALLDEEARTGTLRGALNLGARLVEGELRLDSSRSLGTAVVDAREIQAMISAIHHLLEKSRDIAQSLADNAERDPFPEVRRRNLLALAAHHPKSPHLARAAATALHDVDPEVRLLGATLEGGEAGLAALEELLRSAEVAPGARSRALGHLVRLAPRDRALAAARGALKEDTLRFEAVAALGALRDVDSLDLLCELSREPPLAEACADALRELGDARAQPALLELLSHPNTRGQNAAALALERLGTAEAVAPLLERGKGLLTASTLKDACRSAVRAIQSRLGDVDAGRLSIASQPDVEGALSLGAEGGELSVAAKKPAGS